MRRDELIDQLTCPDPGPLFARADQVQRGALGDGVRLRALIEISNHCRCDCLYCGLRRGHAALVRYRLGAGEIVEIASQAAAAGLDTVVLQAGEDHELVDRDVLGDVVRGIRARETIAITLSLGEWPEETYRAWREAGANRYLLKLETASAALYARLRPGRRLADRVASLEALRRVGLEVGTGDMVGLPGQTIADLADDLLLLRAFEPEMCAIGPFVPHAATPLAVGEVPRSARLQADSPTRAGDLLDLTLRVVALARILLPRAHLPATRALAELSPSGRERGLAVGADVLMLSMTPVARRAHYAIYDRSTADPLWPDLPAIDTWLRSLGRHVAR